MEDICIIDDTMFELWIFQFDALDVVTHHLVGNVLWLVFDGQVPALDHATLAVTVAALDLGDVLDAHAGSAILVVENDCHHTITSCVMAHIALLKLFRQEEQNRNSWHM